MSTVSPTTPDDEAVKAIVASVYPSMLSEPATVRSRAQTAYAAANAIAAALIAAGVLGGIEDFGWVVQVMGVLAVAAWLVTAGLFINISRRVLTIPKAPAGQLLPVDEFVTRSLNVATSEAEALEAQLRRAAAGTYIALALTGLGLLAALLMPPSPEHPMSTLTLSSAGAAAIADACPSAKSELTGKLHVGTLDDDFTVIDVTSKCGEGTVTVRVPPKYIIAVTSGGARATARRGNSSTS